ncbi:MAG: hypothetical protein M1419_08560, partial [Bacteroidetes bacterium]|nr:hypothetical protein [Bacteroidota bacterium]
MKPFRFSLLYIIEFNSKLVLFIKEYVMKILKTLFALLIAVVFSTSLMSQNPYMVKDIFPGAGNGYPAYPAVMNGILYFQANDGTNADE